MLTRRLSVGQRLDLRRAQMLARFRALRVVATESTAQASVQTKRAGARSLEGARGQRSVVEERAASQQEALANEAPGPDPSRRSGLWSRC